MQSTIWTKATLAAGAIGLATLATPAIAAPVQALPPVHAPAFAAPLMIDAGMNSAWEHSRDRGWHDRSYRGRGYDSRYDRRGYRDNYRSRVSYGEPVHSRTRVWRGNDGRYYCRKDNGTTGLLIGAAVGGLAGHEIAGRGDKTLGAVLGAVGGGLLGRAIDRSSMSCR